VSIETIENALEAIAEAKRELLRMDPDDTAKKQLDEAYLLLSKSEKALAALVKTE
jgi:hypothetical protein